MGTPLVKLSPPVWLEAEGVREAVPHKALSPSPSPRGVGGGLVAGGVQARAG
jgi:hypothetical protein